MHCNTGNVSIVTLMHRNTDNVNFLRQWNIDSVNIVMLRNTDNMDILMHSHTNAVNSLVSKCHAPEQRPYEMNKVCEGGLD